MTTFHQRCPSCQRELELPAEAAGKRAICPACETEFVAQDRSPNVPVRPIKIPKTFRRIPIETVLAETRLVFTERRRPLLLPFLLPTVIVFLGILVPLVYLDGLAERDGAAAIAGGVALAPVALLILTYALWVGIRLSQAVCDAGPDDRAPQPLRWTQWAIPQGRSFVALLVVVTLASAIAALLIAALVMAIRSAETMPNLAARIPIYVLASSLVFGAGVFLLTRFWPLFPLSMRLDASKRVFRVAWWMTGPNTMTSFLMTIITMVVVGLCCVLFGVLLPIALPIILLMFVVAARLIDGSPIAALHWEPTADEVAEP
ncbi:hypothetical protein FYK55_00225 [Roseiconus nitratireducens]|uniref:Uncharacterized protein n=1 Tax=Roseiconus nitratireducens TaxID=2605748 RepID=A0A5M6DH76_9BACT|nr:hypothetical protein [Roseiconus nitratireducens]KAA5546894.1 hypothetical protein FYK55_00225 [Roseiconus nitratireducens]